LVTHGGQFSNFEILPGVNPGGKEFGFHGFQVNKNIKNCQLILR